MGTSFLPTWLCAGEGGQGHTRVLSEGHRQGTFPRRGSRTGERVPGLGLNSNDKIKGNLSCMTYPSFPVLLPSPLTRWGDGGRVGLEAQLCYEYSNGFSLLAEVKPFSSGASDGQSSREYGASAFSPQGAAHTPLSPTLALGFALRRTMLHFLTSTWTGEGPTVLLEKSKCAASGSPR